MSPVRTLEDRRQDGKRGLAYEDFVYYMLQKHRGITTTPFRSVEWQVERGENAAGIEIKLNARYDETGNLWIEFCRRSTVRQDYIDSSLVKDTNTWLFVTGSYRRVFAYTVRVLRELRKQRDLRPNGSNTSIGFLLYGPECEKYAEFVIDIPEQDIPGYVEKNNQNPTAAHEPHRAAGSRPEDF